MKTTKNAVLKYRAAVDEAADLVERQKQKVSPFYHEKLDALLDRYARRLAQWKNDYNRNGASCPSVLVCGPANFPTRKKEKQNAREDALWKEYGEIQGILDKIKSVGTGPIDPTDPHAREMLTDRLQRLQATLDRGKAIALHHRWATRYMVNISTNGTLGDDPEVQRFMRDFAGRLSIGVTIDGDKQAHDACRLDCNGCGSYDRAIKMFRETSGPDGKRTTKYTIAPGNLHLFASSVRHLVLDEGCDTVNCNCVYEEGWTADHARELYRQLKTVSDMVQESGTDTYISILDWEAGNHLPDTETQNWCGGDGRMLAFEIDGTVLPCMRYRRRDRW